MDPVGHQLIAQRSESTRIAKHELLGGHANEWLAARLPDQHIDWGADEE